MKPGITLALLASVVLIGGAFWFRFTNTTPQVAIVAVQNEKLPESYYQNLLSDFLSPSASSSPQKTEPLTTTDLVGRQLVLDYISLAQNGQSTDENLAALADQYVQSIPAIITSNKLILTDLAIVPNNKANFQLYSSQVEAAYTTYARNLLGSYSTSATSVEGESTSLKKMGEVYDQAAADLKKLRVPADLASTHLALVNLYIENAVAMKALSQSTVDPTSSFAGLIAIKANAEKEQELLSQIQEVLTKNGI